MTLDLVLPSPTAPVRRADSDRRACMLGPCPAVRTERLTLRAHRMSDAPALVEALSDFEVVRMLSRVPQPYHLADARDRIASLAVGRDDAWHLAIVENAGTDVHIGAIGIERRGDDWHLGYWLARPAWGRGLMTEAARALLAVFFDARPEATLASGAFADNTASLKIQAKLGFAVTGVRDVFVPSRNVAVNLIETRLARPSFVSTR
jgi:RimJ/RimL family protein N-acetyltransferase